MASLAMAVEMAVVKAGLLTVFLGLNGRQLPVDFLALTSPNEVVDHILFQGLVSISGHNCFLNFLEFLSSCNGTNNKIPDSSHAVAGTGSKT